MSREQWRGSLIMFIVGFIIVMLVLALTVQKGASYQAMNNVPLLSSTPLPAANANYVPADGGVGLNPSFTIPSGDAAGASDDPAVPRYPGSLLLDQHNSLLVNQLHYISPGRPVQIANFYADYAHDHLGMNADSFGELGSGVYGYHLAYSNAEQTASVIVFAISQNADVPPGGTQNPTYVNVMLVGQMKPLGQPTPTMPPAWLTPATWNLSPYTPTPVVHR